MDDKQAAEIVSQMATQAHTDAVYQYLKAISEYQGNHAAKETWDSYNPGVGCMGMNPYSRNVEQLSRACDSTLKRERDWKYISDFVIRRICNLLEKPCPEKIGSMPPSK